MPAIADASYVRLTTYTKDGREKHAPVWIADLGDGTVGFTTASSSWKVKRLRNDPRVVLQPSDRTGKVEPGSEAVTGTAVAGPEHFERVKPKIKTKYGFQYTMIGILGSLAKLAGRGSGTDTGVVVTLD